MKSRIAIYHNTGNAANPEFEWITDHFDSMAFAFTDTLRHLTGDVISYFDLYFRLADLGSDNTLDLFIGVSDGWIWHLTRN